MRLVEKETFYHITRENRWNTNPRFEKGKTYKIGEKFNPFRQYFDNIDFQVAGEFIDHHYLRYIEDSHKMRRELVFEEVRRELYPDYPSRYTCLWLLPHNYEAIEDWWRMFGNKGQILKLNVTGKIHETSEAHLKLGYFNLKEERERAIKYWDGKPEGKYKYDEFLFEGSITVEEVYTIEQLRALL